MSTPSLFDSPESSRPTSGPARILITVKAAPNPSELHGETVCVAGLRIDEATAQTSWIRLYPINFRALEGDQSFAKYNIVTVDVMPVNGDHGDTRLESHRPSLQTLRVQAKLESWSQRRKWLDPMVSLDACRLRTDALANPAAPSLALVHAVEVLEIQFEPHTGWTASEQAKIDGYVNQLSLLDGNDRHALEAPRLKGWYVYRCGAPGCRTHRQQILDWEFVRLQMRHQGDPDNLMREALRTRFLEMMCRSGRDVAFYLGNQAKRRHTFSVLGVYYPD